MSQNSPEFVLFESLLIPCTRPKVLEHFGALINRRNFPSASPAEFGRAGNSSRVRRLLIFLFLLLRCKDRIDPLHDVQGELRRDLVGLHILVHLLHTAGASDDCAHIGIL